MEKKNYKDLIIWQRAIEMAPKVYRLVRQFPREETYALSDQVRRAVISIPANIAEGQSRQYPREFLQHLSIAKGSLAELHTLLIVAEKLNYLTAEQLAEVEAELQAIARPLNGLISSIRTRS